jgi:hypothetical protein
LGNNFRVTHLNDPIPDMPFTYLGHTDFYPEYFISTPNNQSVKATDISVLKAATGGKGCAAQSPKDFNAHSWYMNNQISQCYSGPWLGGPDPTPTEIDEMIKTWMEFTAVWMVEKGDDVQIKSLKWLTDLIPKKKPAELPKAAKVT